MTNILIAHVRRNVVAYLALFVALGGTSYAASANSHRSAVKAASHAPAVYAYTPDPAQPLGDGVFAAVHLKQEVFDFGDMHGSGDNDTRIVAPRNGTYVVQATAIFAGGACGGPPRVAIIQRHLKNGVTFNADHTNSGTMCNEPTRLHAGAVVRLRAGDYLELIVLQRSANSVDVGGSLSAAYVGS